MGRSDCLADMNKVYVRIEATHKEHPVIHLKHIGGGPNGCRRQPRPRFGEVEGKFITDRWQHMEEQFAAMGDQIEAFTTRLSNMGGHNGNGFENPFVERRMHGCLYHEQAHANKRVNGFKLNISEFQGDLQPEEFLNWVLGIEEVLEFKGVFDERRVSLVVRTFRERVVAW
jgi:hypothetical protein